MKHRGPDAQKTLQISDSPCVIFGHDRLAIIDLSSDATQPMTDSTTGNAIVFNGEIYNFKILRKELQKKGYSFRTQSDTEVILHAYSAWGLDFVTHLRGIYALALWDSRQQKCILTRDIIGVKPLYVYQQGHELRFASEVRALLSSGIPSLLDRDGLLSALAYGSLQEPYTLVKEVRSLQPGHLLIWQQGELQDIPFSLELSPAEGKEEDLREEIVEELKSALKMQMVSDVPVGAFLSGGIDSSAIVSILRQVRPDITLHTFSLIFEDPALDERTFARLVAKQNKTCHKELLLDNSALRKNVTRALDDVDQPSYDGLNTWFVTKFAKEAGLTVALSGLGGDELFIGYNQFSTPRRMAKACSFLRFAPPFPGQKLAAKTDSEKMRKMLLAFGQKDEPYYLARQIFSPLTCSQLLDIPFSDDMLAWKETAFPFLHQSLFPNDPLNRYSFLEMTTYLRSTLLRDADQMSMAHALELRVPLIDPVVVQKMLRLASHAKISGDTAKPLLVNTAKDGIPSECLQRPKQGFNMPFDSFFSQAFKKPIKELFFEGKSSLFSPRVLKTFWEQHQQGKLAWSRLWLLYSLESYCNKHQLH